MTTGKIVGIAAAVLLVIMAVVGVCVYESSSEDNPPEASAVKLSVSDRIAALEQAISDLTRQLQTVKQDNAQLQTQLSTAMSEIRSLERELETLRRER